MDNKNLPPNDHRPPHGRPIPPHGVPPYGTYDMYAPHKHFHGKPDNHTAHFTPHLLHYHIPNSFKFWCNKVIPLVYDDSLSYMELLNKIVMYLDGMLEDEKLVAVNMEEIVRAYHELEHFVNDYFAFYQSKGIVNNDIAVTNSNYLEILPDCDTAQMNTVYRLKFVEGSEQNIPANLPESAIPFSGAECILLNLSNFILKRMGGEWQEVPPNGKQADTTNNYQMLITDKDIFFRENNGDTWGEWQSIFGNWWNVEWVNVKKYIDDSDEYTRSLIDELVGSLGNLAYKDSVSAEYTPHGSVSQPLFTGSEQNFHLSGTPTGSVSQGIFTGTNSVVAVSGVPVGTVSQSTFAGNNITIDINEPVTGTAVSSFVGNEETVNINASSTPVWTKENVSVVNERGTTPTLDYDANTETLTFNGGSMPTFRTIAAVVNGTINTTGNVTITPSGSVATSLTMDNVEYTETFTPSGTISQPTFTGAPLTLSGSYTPAGTINQQTFVGAPMDVDGSFTPQGTVSVPLFTGETETIISE